jgi:HEAT repeat protein
MLRAAILLAVVTAGTGIVFAADVPAGRDGAWGVLDKSLGDGNADRRQEALASLATISGPNAEAVRRAEAALKDKEPLIRQSAALTLGEMKALEAAPALRSLLDDSPEIAFAAAKALTAVGDLSGRDVLIAVLAGERKDEPGMVTGAMRKAKDKLHHPEGLILMGAQDATGAMFGPVSMVIPAIKDAADMKGKGGPGRAAAAAWLAKYPDPYAITLLEWALNDENQLVRVEAAKGLGDRGNAETVAKLEPLLTDSHNFVRDMAAASIIRVLDRNGNAGPVSASRVTPAAMAKH